MVPGMGHCGGGNGASTFDMVAALDGWRDGGKAPEQVNASRVRDGKVDRTRPLCAWPAVARYKGIRQHRRAANFFAGGSTAVGSLARTVYRLLRLPPTRLAVIATLSVVVSPARTVISVIYVR